VSDETPSGGLFAGIFARGRVAGRVGDEAWVQAMLDVEAALARANARAGLIPEDAAEAIAAACDATRFDAAAIGREAARSATPVIALVGLLREQAGDAAAEHVHHGATSQDIVDTAAMLVARRALEPLLDDSAGAAARCAELAAAHRDTPQIGRTLLQQAVPTTFGAKAATWLAGLDQARRRLAAVARDDLAVQLGGAAGTLAAFGGRGPDVLRELAHELGLAEPAVPWHTVRVRPAALASALAALAGVAGKAARDVTLLAQTEVGEVREAAEPGRGGSSAMPHKSNPVAAVCAVACAARVPGLVATIHTSMIAEHERAAGAWQAEWETMNDVLRLTGAAVAWAREMLEVLEIDAERMRANLGDAASGEHVAAAGIVVDRALAAHAVLLDTTTRRSRRE
jgi:3-carboxy-cis,cis-muconate cycloisomerase